MTTAVIIILYVSIAALAYIQFGYLAALALLSRLRRHVTKQQPICPSVSFIVPAHNEGRNIIPRIENLKSLDYPSELIEIIIVSDCSTDDTAEQCRSTEGISFIELKERGGKPAALNAGLEIATGRIIAFTDAAAMLEPDALRLAVAHFADPRVGCVSSEDIVLAKGGVGEGEGLYIRIDTAIRRLESEVASATGMSGSFYLVRRDLCPPFPVDLATDMFSALYCVERDCFAIVEPSSKTRIAAQPDPACEFSRKVRTMVTGLRALRAFPHMLNPFRYGIYAWCLISHKILRYLTPFFASFVLISMLYLSFSSLTFRLLLALILAVAGISLLQIKVNTSTQLPGIIKAPGFFCIASAAAVIGWYRFLRGERFVTWQPTERVTQ